MFLAKTPVSGNLGGDQPFFDAGLLRIEAIFEIHHCSRLKTGILDFCRCQQIEDRLVVLKKVFILPFYADHELVASSNRHRLCGLFNRTRGIRIWFEFVLVLVGAQAPLLAHPGHSHSANLPGRQRIWTDVVQSRQIQGDFVAAHDGQLQIRQADESLIRLKIADLALEDQAWINQRQEQIRRQNEFVRRFSLTVVASTDGDVDEEQETPMRDLIAAQRLPLLLAQRDPVKGRPQKDDAEVTPEIAKAFEAFVRTKAIKTRWDENFFYVESNGMPDHRMMVGITAWQQQVPLPQAYTGENSWRIPLFPKPAKKPLTTKNNFLRGAIAIAANGVPIFNPLNNRGEDAFLFGELDEFGGHCGRADDYHYHIAPTHLAKTVGEGLPIAYALDGYPIYGYDEPDGSKVVDLDAFNGHKDKNGNYHYHASKKYPYLNGGFYGEVVERGGQVDPQPRSEPVRPDGRPLRDAKIVDFVESAPGSYKLTYELRGAKGSVSYSIAGDGSVSFTFVDPNGSSRTEKYSQNRRGPGGNNRQPPPPPPRDGQRPPDRKNPPPPRREDEPQAAAAKRRSDLPELKVTSTAVNEKGFLASEFTCDGSSASPPVEWGDAPEGTKSFAISLWHTAPDMEKSYWVIYNIPADVKKIPKNNRAIGKLGYNDRRRADYDPMCSKGPGVKTYHITVYALSSELKLPADKVTRATLLESIKEITLGEGTLDFQYERNK